MTGSATQGAQIADTPAVRPGDFCRDTAVEAAAPARFEAHIPESWRVIYAFGGVSMAVALRAIQEEVGRDDLQLSSAHAVFCSAVPCSQDLAIETDVLRNGRTAAQGRGLLRVAGSDEVGISASATFGQRTPSPFTFQDTSLPDRAGSPDDHDPPPARPDDAPFPVVPFHEQTDWRPAIGTKWWEEPIDWEPGPALTGAWVRLVTAPVDDQGRFDPLALCLPGDQLGSAIGQYLGPDERDEHFFTVTLEMGLQWFADQETPWVFQLVRSPIASGGDGWGTVELFGENGSLLAVATQRARLRAFRPGDGFFG